MALRPWLSGPSRYMSVLRLICYIANELLAWILASLIPLPPAPVLTPPVTPTSPNVAHDLEKAVGSIDQARYENARWWRNINRIMAVVGILIIAAIVRFRSLILRLDQG